MLGTDLEKATRDVARSLGVEFPAVSRTDLERESAPTREDRAATVRGDAVTDDDAEGGRTQAET